MPLDATRTPADDVVADVTGALAGYIATCLDVPVPAEIAEMGRLHLLDTLAATIACTDLEPARAARRFTRAHSGALTTPIPGTGETASLVDAAFATAMTAHAAEINDFCPSAYVQPGPAVVSTALLLGSDRRRTGRDLLRAVIAGYEVACRLPKAIGAEALRDTGVANHGLGSLFGAAAAASACVGLGTEQVRSLLSLTAQQASGSWQWLLDVEHIEKAMVFAGMGARSGAQTALLVEAGFTGVTDSLDHPLGWLRSPYLQHEADRLDTGYLVRDLGTRFELPSVGFKKYPVGGPTQPAVEAMLALVPQLAAREIAAVEILMPSHNSRAFAGALMPALNLPYLAAIIAIDGRLDFVSAQSLARMHDDAEVQALMKRVTVVPDPSQDRFPRVESAIVIILLADGSRLEHAVEHVKGFPAYPMDRDDVIAKTLDLVGPHLGADGAKALCDLVLDIDRVTDLAQVIDAMRAR